MISAAMAADRRLLAILQLILMLPALLFMGAVAVRYAPGLQRVQRVVIWYAGKKWTLWLLLIALPLAAFMLGCGALLGSTARSRTLAAAIDARRGIRLVMVRTASAAVVLAIVVLHMLAN